MMKQSISIIIPIKSNRISVIDELCTYLHKLDNDLEATEIEYEIIIADECPNNLSKQFEELSLLENIVHIVPLDRSGKNDKLNGVYASIKQARKEYCLIVDDHYRITATEIAEIIPCFEEFDLFKVVPIFEKYSMDVMIDQAGFFFRCVFDKRKQYAGHIAMKLSLYKKFGFPDRNGLYDEYIVETYYSDKGAHCGFPKKKYFTATQRITVSKFLEQRIRYSYENIAFPMRFIAHLCLLPFFVISIYTTEKYALLLFLLYVSYIMLVSFWGQVKYGKSNMPPVFLFAGIWHLSYWITSWIALFLFWTRGVSFGENRIHNPR